METRRFVRIASPILAVVTAAFAFYQLFLAGLSLRAKAYPTALFFAVMGIGGLALATALWRVRKSVTRHA